jgi:hypothetical protein
MRTRILSLTACLLVPAMIGCGDDNNDNKMDAAPPDPDAAPPAFKGFDADEGGEVRFEYVRFAGGNAGARMTAFAFKDSGATKYFPYPNLNGCTDVSNKQVWPLATNDIATRQYYDIGKVIISGGPQPLEVPRRATMGNDPFGRTHPANGWNFHFGGGTATDGPTYQSEKARYDVIFTGSADFPGQIFDDVLYMPADFQLTTPGTTPFAIPADMPQTFGWQVTDTNVPAGYTIQSLVAFTGANGPVVLCIEPNDGSITVPKEMINVARAKYPAGGTLARQTLTHVVRELKDKDGKGTGKRIDFISVWCYATAFTVP